MRLFCWLQPPHIINIFQVKTTKSKITGPHKQTRVKPLRGVEEKKKKGGNTAQVSVHFQTCSSLYFNNSDE